MNQGTVKINVFVYEPFCAQPQHLTFAMGLGEIDYIQAGAVAEALATLQLYCLAETG